jgi:putative metal-binding protein
MLFKNPIILGSFMLLSLVVHAQNRPFATPEEIMTPTPYYSDSDGDGFGDPAVVIFSTTGAPAGFVADNTDCNPASAAEYRTALFYVDADNDRFYDGNPFPVPMCYGLTTPEGYVAMIVGSDCDDTLFEVNPNHVEVLANGTDDNCDGHIDEPGPYVSLMPAFCGNVLPRVGTDIFATTLPGVTGWRFEVTIGETVTTFDSDVNHFSLEDLPIAPTYLATYSVRISARTEGFWRAYAPPCTVETPRAPITTTLLTHQCGMSMTNMGNIMYCYQNPTATLYRFELSDGVTPPRFYDTPNSRFVMQNFIGSAEFGTTYTVRIALFISGAWEDFGPECTVTTPPLPELSNLIDSLCGITISNTWTTLYTGQVPEAEGYRFEVTNGSSIRFYDSPISHFNLHNLAGAAPAASTVYSVRVAIMYHGAYLDFGPPCTITTASVITRPASIDNPVSKAKAAPNPFSESFRVLAPEGKDSAHITVYDVFGKVIETAGMTNMESGVELGTSYPSGVYTVVLMQGEEEQILRVVKR